MTIAMPAMTAKAANRLPLTPNFGRLKPLSLTFPMLNRNAICPPPRAAAPGILGRQYRGTRLTTLENANAFRYFWLPEQIELCSKTALEKASANKKAGFDSRPFRTSL
jgi:hypothetical protein